MNDPSKLDMTVLNRDAILNNIMYMDYDAQNGDSVNNILDNAGVKLDNKIAKAMNEGMSRSEAEAKYADDIRRLNATRNAVERNPNVGELKLVGQSSQMNDPATGQPYEKGGLSASAFVDDVSNPSEVTVVYRGTGKGEWFDNGIGLAGNRVTTEQQVQAQQYFDAIVEEYGWDQSRPKVHMTGHSKGGNKNQYTVMMSKYSDLIVDGYSMDGQCMSPEEIEWMRKELGDEEFERRRSKLYAISADNDYVNILGANRDGRLIPDDQIYYLESTMDGKKWHYSDCYMNEDGTLTGFTEQGEISQFLQSMSETLMDLPAPLRGIITEGAMSLAQIFLGGTDPVNGESISYAKLMASVPMILELLPASVITLIGDKFGVDLGWLSNAVSVVTLFLLWQTNVGAFTIGLVIDIALYIRDKLIELGEKCKELTQRFVAFINNTINKIKDWYKRNFNEGYKYAQSHPFIWVDTYLLRGYADRVAAVNRRLDRVDRRMDGLYDEVRKLDIGKLQWADMKTGYSRDLVKCVNYLLETAADFENAEARILNANA